MDHTNNSVPDSDSSGAAPAGGGNENAGGATAAMSVVIAMATFKRPECLVRILPLLVEQAAAAAHPTRIVVVDNDPAGGAESAVGQWSGQNVTYEHEPRPGISAARNRALAGVGQDDLLIFIDDDEVPTPGWLDALVAAWLQWRCAAIAGPVEAEFEGYVEPWALASGLFTRRQRLSGTVLGGAASNNLLLDLAQIRSHGLTFDENFGLSGGSDTMLTHRLIRQGGEIRWCDEAVVKDFIPAGRSTRRWVIKRIYRTSNTWSRVALQLADTGTARSRCRASLTIRGLKRATIGALRATRGSLTGDLSHRARGVCAVVSGWGMIVGAYGGVTHEYLRDPG